MNNLTSIQKEDARLYNTKEKWYVRGAWLSAAMERLCKEGKQHIRYFTLTCSMVYDVKFFVEHGIIAKSDIQYDGCSLMFCEKMDHRHALIKNQLPGAQSSFDTFENMVGAGRIGVSKVVDKFFPCDVINLDINGAPFGANSRFFLINHNAIAKLFFMQKHQSFTLFLTVRSHLEGDDGAKKERLNDLLQRNREQDEFNITFNKRFTDANDPPYHKFLMIMIPKLVIKAGFPDFDVSCTQKFTYIGGDNVARMVSFIFECKCIDDSNNLEGLKRRRMLEMLEQKYEDVNSILDGNTTISNECQQLVEEHNYNSS